MQLYKSIYFKTIITIISFVFSGFIGVWISKQFEKEPEISFIYDGSIVIGKIQNEDNLDLELIFKGKKINNIQKISWIIKNSGEKNLILTKDPEIIIASEYKVVFAKIKSVSKRIENSYKLENTEKIYLDIDRKEKNETAIILRNFKTVRNFNVGDMINFNIYISDVTDIEEFANKSDLDKWMPIFNIAGLKQDNIKKVFFKKGNTKFIEFNSVFFILSVLLIGFSLTYSVISGINKKIMMKTLYIYQTKVNESKNLNLLQAILQKVIKNNIDYGINRKLVERNTFFGPLIQFKISDLDDSLLSAIYYEVKSEERMDIINNTQIFVRRYNLIEKNNNFAINGRILIKALDYRF